MCEDIYNSDLDKWITEMPNQLKIIFPEDLVRRIYDTLPRETADSYIIRLLRYFIYGEDYNNSPTRVEGEELLLDLLAQKVGCFGISMYEEGVDNGESK